MFARAEAALLQAFGMDVLGSVHHSSGHGEAFIVRFNGKLTICGKIARESTLRHRIRAAKLMPELVNTLISSQERLLKDVQEALATLREFVAAFDSDL